MMGDALCDLWRQRWREIEQGLKKIDEEVRKSKISLPEYMFLYTNKIGFYTRNPYYCDNKSASLPWQLLLTLLLVVRHKPSKCLESVVFIVAQGQFTGQCCILVLS